MKSLIHTLIAFSFLVKSYGQKSTDVIKIDNYVSSVLKDTNYFERQAKVMADANYRRIIYKTKNELKCVNVAFQDNDICKSTFYCFEGSHLIYTADTWTNGKAEAVYSESCYSNKGKLIEWLKDGSRHDGLWKKKEEELINVSKSWKKYF